VLLVLSLYRENSESTAIAKLSSTGSNRECLACTGLYAPGTMFPNQGISGESLQQGMAPGWGRIHFNESSLLFERRYEAPLVIF